MTLKLMASFLIAFIFSVSFGKPYIKWLQKVKMGQPIKEEVTWHQNKAGIPTMGGFMFILAILLVCLTVGFSSMLKGRYTHMFIFLFASVFGGIGMLDDWKKISSKANAGMSAKTKFALQLAASALFIFIMMKTGFVRPHLYVPFFNVSVDIPTVLYYVFAVFVIVGTVNAVNITDGIDGLSATTTIPVCLFYSVLAFYWGENYLEIGMFASALMGGLLGYLRYNFHPAKVFMGDTGSLFMGGVVAACAFAYDMPLILITLGIIYIIETLSDIIQVTYFKLTHGKRVFKMAPFHHHLEKGGWFGKKWKEVEICALFGSISFIFAIISFIGVYHRF